MFRDSTSYHPRLINTYIITRSAYITRSINTSFILFSRAERIHRRRRRNNEKKICFKKNLNTKGLLYVRCTATAIVVTFYWKVLYILGIFSFFIYIHVCISSSSEHRAIVRKTPTDKHTRTPKLKNYTYIYLYIVWRSSTGKEKVTPTAEICGRYCFSKLRYHDV